jgi:hypothetical protein
LAKQKSIKLLIASNGKYVAQRFRLLNAVIALWQTVIVRQPQQSFMAQQAEMK